MTACRATLIDFLSAIDDGRAIDALELFTDDASFAARGRQLQGRHAIARFLQERRAKLRPTATPSTFSATR